MNRRPSRHETEIIVVAICFIGDIIFPAVKVAFYLRKVAARLSTALNDSERVMMPTFVNPALPTISGME
jgi:hypothetical protein